MTDWIDNLPLDDDLQLDLLVDNELNDAQRQRLLTWLEGEPERWRVVALRFVEAQMLTSSVGRWTAETRDTETPVRPAAGSDSRRRNRIRHRWLMALTVCAAFGCGLAVEAWRGGVGDQVERPIAEITAPEITVPENTQEPRAVDVPSPETSVASVATKSMPRSVGGRSMKVPMRLVRAAEGSPTWSPRVRLTRSRERQLQQAGLAVQRRAGTVRIPLGGERYVMMPAQHLQFVPRVRYRI